MTWLLSEDQREGMYDFEPGDCWVKEIALIRKNATGEIRSYENDAAILEAGAEYPSTFIWEDGNYACDCNRELFFERAGGIEPGATNCGVGRYSVNLENPADGTVFYREFE